MNVTQGTIKRITLQAFLDHFSCTYILCVCMCAAVTLLLLWFMTERHHLSYIDILFVSGKNYYTIILHKISSTFGSTKGLISLLNCVVIQCSYRYMFVVDIITLMHCCSSLGNIRNVFAFGELDSFLMEVTHLYIWIFFCALSLFHEI